MKKLVFNQETLKQLSEGPDLVVGGQAPTYGSIRVGCDLCGAGQGYSRMNQCVTFQKTDYCTYDVNCM